MSDPIASWRALPQRSRILAAAGIIVPLVIVSGLIANLVMSPAPSQPPLADASFGDTSPEPSTTNALPPTPSPDLSATPSPSPTPAPPGTDRLLGTDGRLTVLLLGSDYRPSHPGNRTDAMMVVSIDPTTGKSAAFSVPRDTVDFPMPGKGAYSAKVNGLYQYLQSTMGDGGKGLKQAFARAFGLEIDRYVLIGFAGVNKLVRAVGGVDVTLSAPYYDPEYWVTNTHRGWGLPAGTSHLDGPSALIFARSRKGDNDFARARRQQQLVMAAVAKVRKSGVASLPSLLSIAANTVRTDMPLDRAADLFALFSTVDLSKVDRTVFGPRRYAVAAGGTDYRLALGECKKWIAANFPPARPKGTWPAS